MRIIITTLIALTCCSSFAQTKQTLKKKPTLTRESLKAGSVKTDKQFKKELEQTSAWNRGKGTIYSSTQVKRKKKK